MKIYLNDINKLAECTDSNQAFNLFQDLFWSKYQKGSFSTEALELYY